MTSRCRHIRVSGHRCTTPALDNASFCFYHSAHRLDAKARSVGYPPPTLRLPPLEDHASIQVAIHLILDQVASGMLHPKRGGLLLYGVQIAATLLRHQPPQPQTLTEPLVQNPIHDHCEGIIAPKDPASVSPESEANHAEDHANQASENHEHHAPETSEAAAPADQTLTPPPAENVSARSHPIPAASHPTPNPAESGDIPVPWRNLGPTDPIPDLSALRDPRFCLPCP